METAVIEPLLRYAAAKRYVRPGVSVVGLLAVEAWPPRDDPEDWRCYIPRHVRECWSDLSQDARMVAYLSASDNRYDAVYRD